MRNHRDDSSCSLSPGTLSKREPAAKTVMGRTLFFRTSKRAGGGPLVAGLMAHFFPTGPAGDHIGMDGAERRLQNRKRPLEQSFRFVPMPPLLCQHRHIIQRRG